VGRLRLRPGKKLGVLPRRVENIDSLGKLFSQKLAEVVVDGGAAFQTDVVAPAPLHRERERERGYNQALIARSLAKRLGLPYKSVLLTRIRPRPDKHLLSYEERWESRPWRFCHTSRQPG
jgi:predicted amidophosphoribosyltransferase